MVRATPVITPFCLHFRAAVERCGQSQAEIARRAKTAQAVVSRVLNGYLVPSVELAERLANASGMQLRWDVDLDQATILADSAPE